MTSMSLDSISINSKPLPPKIVIHGPQGVGKTTFACQAPSPIVIRTEDRLGIIRVPAFPLATEYQDVYNAIATLYREPHQYKTVILDTLDWLEPMVWARTAFEGGKSDIEEFGYGKGYVKADEYWLSILNGLNALRAKGMLIICIAHCEIKRFESPETEPYDRYSMKLHKRANALVTEWADIIGFARHEVVTTTTDVGFNKKITRGVGTGSRRLALEERPAFDAKNSYNLPPELPLDWVTFRQELKQAFAAAGTPLDPSTDSTIKSTNGDLVNV